MDITAHITRSKSRLSPSEQKVADWLLENPRLAVTAPIAAVANAAGVSEPTVIRCCRSLGLSGFRELRTRLIAAAQRPDNYVHKDVLPGDDTVTAVGKVMDSCIRGLIQTAQQLSGLPLDAAVDIMSRARQLVFVGLGASGHVARDAAHKFFRLGTPVSVVLDAQTMLQQAAIARPADVFVILSSTGSWPEVVDTARLARQRGAAAISLTAPGSPLDLASTLTLTLQTQEDTSVYTPMISRLTQLALLDGMQVALALKLGNDATENLQLSKAALNSDRRGYLG